MGRITTFTTQLIDIEEIPRPFRLRGQEHPNYNPKISEDRRQYKREYNGTKLRVYRREYMSAYMREYRKTHIRKVVIGK